MKKLQRLLKLHQGGEKFVPTPICECVGTAQRMHVDCRFMGWTEGRRGPKGGVCGACGGAIPDERGK